jgi:hypothetical protein
LRLGLEEVLIHVAQGDDVAAATGGVVNVAVAFAVDADAGDGDSVIGAEDMADKGEGKGGGTQSACADEMAAGQLAGARADLIGESAFTFHNEDVALMTPVSSTLLVVLFPFLGRQFERNTG